MFRRNSYKVLLALLAVGFVFTMFSVYNQPLDSITGEDALASRMGPLGETADDSVTGVAVAALPGDYLCYNDCP